MSEFLSSVQKVFLAHGWRITAGVQNIVSLLEKTERPISSAEIRTQLEKSGRPIDLTTVYRILDRLVAVHLVHPLQGKFFRCTDPENKTDSHHFLICDNCGKAEEIFLDYFKSIEQQLHREKRFGLREVEMSFYGLCSECRKN